MPDSIPDVIDTLAGIAPGSPLDAIRAGRPQARLHAQTSYRALFAPDPPGGVTTAERFAIASFVAGLHGQAETVQFYAAQLAETGMALHDAIQAELPRAAGSGPYGSYPEGPLTAENTPGPEYRVDAPHRAALGRLAAALEHAHMLVLHPRDSSASRLQALLDAGWHTDDIVTISQLVAFLSFQIRVIAGLRTLAATA